MTFTVFGLPGPQGSKRFVGRAKSGRGILVESSAKVKPWREAVRWTALEAIADKKIRFTGAVEVSMIFTLPKPKSASKCASASKRPDLSKLVRSTEDALTDSGIWEDDARVIRCFSEKHYAGSSNALNVPGCVIRIAAVSQ